MFYYVPLEGYKERYTLQWSAPTTGWLERNWIKYSVPYKRIEGSLPDAKSGTIRTGSVVDAIGRSTFCFDQIKQLLWLADSGTLTSEDVIYFDDFWTPGIEALPYAFALLGINPKVFAFLHAQTVDRYDFTYPMRHWMRHFEKGIGEFLTGIFVCCPSLRDLVIHGQIAEPDKVHVTGHPFNSEEVLERMPQPYQTWRKSFDKDERTNGYDGAPETETIGPKRKNQIVWSSRWDEEKNPLFFLKVVEATIKQNEYAKFVICTGAEKLRSNNPHLITALYESLFKYPFNLFLRERLTKEEYYAILCESKGQINTAQQDWVAITLLEASVAGCLPIYPYFRSFPETFNGGRFLYQHLNVESAANACLTVIGEEEKMFSTPPFSSESVASRSWYHSRFDDSWIRMLRQMDIPIEDKLPSKMVWTSRQPLYKSGNFYDPD